MAASTYTAAPHRLTVQISTTSVDANDASGHERDTLLSQNDRLRHLLLQLRRLHFGPRSERLAEEQLQLLRILFEAQMAGLPARGPPGCRGDPLEHDSFRLSIRRR